MPLDEYFHKIPVDAQTRIQIIENLWPRAPELDLHQQDLDWESYLSYYSQECLQALHSNGRYVSVRTHEDIIFIAKRIAQRNNKDTIIAVLRGKLTQSRPATEEDEMLQGSVNLAARLLTMMDFGVLQYGFSGRVQLDWKRGTLQENVHHYFNGTPVLAHDNVKLGADFTARNLSRIAGVDVVWTSNLADHLRLVDDDRRVRIFHHASFLKWQKGWAEPQNFTGLPTDHLGSRLFPAGLMGETLDTLALLFPQADLETQNWFEQIRSQPTNPVVLDRMLIKCGRLRAERRQMEEFRYWHDRLVVLKQVFDQSRPATLSQWWHDRRNGVQWYTFWVAATVLFLTVFFGMIQSIEGAMQVYKAYHPTPI